MAARFPQSGSAVAYQIKAAWSSKIKVLYWAAGADSLHRLRSGDTVTTILTRSASGCTFDSTNGVIAGTNDTTYFTDSIAGGYGTFQEGSNFTFGGGFYGDLFNGGGGCTMLASLAPPDTFDNGFKLRQSGTSLAFKVQNGSSNQFAGEVGNDVAAIQTVAIRHDKSDATAHIRPWIDGAEATGRRVATSGATSTNLLGDTARPLYLGGSFTGTGNTKLHFEFAFLAASLSDADMATITSDPASIIEVASSPTRLSIPTSQLTLPRSALAASSSHSFRRFG